MCYSALVKQHVKSLGLRYSARIDLNAFAELFTFRLSHPSIKIPSSLEQGFLDHAKTDIELKIVDLIHQWRQTQAGKWGVELEKQKLRLISAQEKIGFKATKKLSEDIRIATQKIENLRQKLFELNEPAGDEARIFPFVYAPIMVFEKGERVIKPFRYQLRKADQDPSVDFKLDTYNARRDSLKEKAYWSDLYGKNHGVLVISRFYENVKKHDYEQRALFSDEHPVNLILEFKPDDLPEMLVPCVFDRNDAGEFTLHSFALITDEPNPEVLAAGHDRTPVVMKEEHLDAWLKTNGKSLSSYDVVFDDQQPTYFKHRIA